MSGLFLSFFVSLFRGDLIICACEEGMGRGVAVIEHWTWGDVVSRNSNRTRCN